MLQHEWANVDTIRDACQSLSSEHERATFIFDWNRHRNNSVEPVQQQSVDRFINAISESRARPQMIGRDLLHFRTVRGAQAEHSCLVVVAVDDVDLLARDDLSEIPHRLTVEDTTAI